MRSASAVVLVTLLIAIPVACGDLAGNEGKAPPADGGPTPTPTPTSTSPTEGGGPLPIEDATAPEDANPEPDAGAPDPYLENGTLPPNAVLGSCDPSTWKVTASESATSQPPENVLDGLPPTRWSTGRAQLYGQYLQIDFGGFVIVREVTFDNAWGARADGDFPRRVDVLASYDGATFSKTLTTSSFPEDAGSVSPVAFAAHPAAYLRMQLTSPASSWWSVRELRVACEVPGADGGTPDAAATPDAASFADAGSGAPISASNFLIAASSSSPNTDDALAHLTDGNTTTRWSSGKGQSGDESITINLGAVSDVSRVWITASSGAPDAGDGADFALAYAVDVSTDGTTFTTVTKGVGTPVIDARFAKQSAQYVRIRQIGSESGNWWSIYELAIYN